jgi:hypothetical protein
MTDVVIAMAGGEKSPPRTKTALEATIQDHKDTGR